MEVGSGHRDVIWRRKPIVNGPPETTGGGATFGCEMCDDHPRVRARPTPLRRMWTLARATASEQLLATNVLRVTTRLGLSVEALCIVSDTCEYYSKKCRGGLVQPSCHSPHTDNTPGLVTKRLE